MRPEEKYKFVWSNYQSLLTIEMNIEATGVLKEYIWNDIENIFEIAENNVVRCFYGLDDIEHDKERGKLFLDDGYFQQFQNDILREKEEFQKQIQGGSISHYLRSSLKDITEREHNSWLILLAREYDEKKIIKHLYEYPWLVAQHFTFKDALETMEHRFEENRNEVPKQKEKIDGGSRGEIKEVLSLEGRKLADRLAWLAWSRLEVKECWAGLDFYLIPLMEEVARRSGECIYDLQKYYLSFEIEDLLNGKPLTQTEKNKRKECFVGLLENKKITYYSGSEALVIARRELGELYRPQRVDNIKGVTARKGYAKGRVRILGANDLMKARMLREEFRPGEILVTQMTQPNIIDIAKRAGAIVTDEGGMLSHAAVISREFGIPCIVATNIATQVLKDGDLVEVDADNGVVRVLERASERVASGNEEPLLIQTGKVQKGGGQAKDFGYPTANIAYAAESGFLGTYAGQVMINKAVYKAAVYADPKRGLLEAHLFDFSGDLYDQEIQITLLARVAEPAMFTSETDARAFITRAVQKVKDYFQM